ncbi:hypothetical protein niasHT_011546 [Heterodera trifolii]|uniref:F-box domain-containing protein n=1 Tax=Heterodera trifolii TaxID=157864 RepID=A0ABD2LGQ4_9BILA
MFSGSCDSPPSPLRPSSEALWIFLPKRHFRSNLDAFCRRQPIAAAPGVGDGTAAGKKTGCCVGGGNKKRKYGNNEDNADDGIGTTTVETATKKMKPIAFRRRNLAPSVESNNGTLCVLTQNGKSPEVGIFRTNLDALCWRQPIAAAPGAGDGTAASKKTGSGGSANVTAPKGTMPTTTSAHPVRKFVTFIFHVPPSEFLARCSCSKECCRASPEPSTYQRAIFHKLSWFSVKVSAVKFFWLAVPAAKNAAGLHPNLKGSAFQFWLAVQEFIQAAIFHNCHSFQRKLSPSNFFGSLFLQQRMLHVFTRTVRLSAGCMGSGSCRLALFMYDALYAEHQKRHLRWWRHCTAAALDADKAFSDHEPKNRTKRLIWRMLDSYQILLSFVLNCYEMAQPNTPTVELKIPTATTTTTMQFCYNKAQQKQQKLRFCIPAELINELLLFMEPLKFLGVKRLLRISAIFYRLIVCRKNIKNWRMPYPIIVCEAILQSEFSHLPKWPLILRRHCNNLPFLSIHTLDIAAKYFVISETDSPSDYLLTFNTLVLIDQRNHPCQQMRDLNSLLCAKLNAAAGTMADIYGALLLHASFDGTKNYTMVSVSFRREHEPFLAEFSALCTNLNHFLLGIKQYVDERFPADF